MEFSELLLQLFAELKEQGFEDARALSEASRIEASSQKMDAYLDLLIRWRTKVDLVSDASREELFRRHVLDSVASLYVLSDVFQKERSAQFLSAADIGSGAGLPGLVWAILDPSLQVFLVEPRGRRVQFLKEVKRSLNLDNVVVLKSSMENVSRETFSTEETPKGLEVCVARALGKEAQYFKECLRILSTAGLASIMVGPTWEESSFSPYEGSLVSYSFSDSEASRGLAIISS